MPYTNDTKPVVKTGSDIFTGNPIGLLLCLTYAEDIIAPGITYSNDSKNTTSYSNDLKP